MSPAEIRIVTCVLLTNAAFRGSPFTFTRAPRTKFDPFTARVKAGPPATTIEGLSDEIAGGGSNTLKAMLVESPPPGAGFRTAIAKLPATSTSAEKIAAVSCVELTKVVCRGVPPNTTLAPLTKFVPVTVSVKPPLPNATDAGAIDEMVGSGFTGPPAMALKIETVSS